ncbi:MAG: hypothetical protein KJZ79_11540 [Bryobacteraceae bacterium]|nr:hypothetical protein [Bryobacteraceae bacterium]
MKCRFGLGLLLLLSALLVGPASGLDSDRQVLAFPAEIEIIDQPGCAATTIFVQPEKATGHLPRVYVAQHAPGQSMLPPWKGAARVFLSKGLLAWVTGGDSGVALSFPDQPVPPSLAPFNLKKAPMIGLAVYGEHAPIPAERLQQLLSTDRCTGSRR